MSPLAEPHCRAVARLLARTVDEVLWPRHRDRVLRRSRRLRLRVRVGSGRATYHRVERRATHTIVFGWKMVQAKSRGWAVASEWTSGRELGARVADGAWFGGRLDLATVLAHAACHEFAHLLQVVEGGRRRGSVHNAAFHALLEQLHRDGSADAVLAFLEAGCRDEGVDLRWPDDDARPATTADGQILLFDEHADRRAVLRSADSGSPASATPAVEHRPGDHVAFVARGRRITGTVRRVNRRTLTIVPDRPESPGQYWRVGPRHVERD